MDCFCYWLLCALALSILFLTGIPSELAPLEDRNQFRLSVTAPEGTSYDYMDSYMDTSEQVYNRFRS